MREPRQDPYWLRWSFVAHFANNELSRLIGIVPLVGYLILFSDPIIENFSFSIIAGVSDQGTSPFFLGGITKLRLVFFGSLFVFVSNILFRVFVPSCILQSNDGQEFSERVINTFSFNEVRALENRCRDENHVIRTEIYSYSPEFNPLNNRVPLTSHQQNRKRLIQHYGDQVRLLANEYWASGNNANRAARVATLLFAVSGFFMLSIPSLDIIHAVIRDLL